MKNALKKRKMRTKEFEVPTEIIAEFSDALAENNLDNEILGTNEEGEVIVQVSYEKDEREGVFALTEIIDDYFEEEESEEEEEEEEEEEPRPSKRKK